MRIICSLWAKSNHLFFFFSLNVCSFEPKPFILHIIHRHPRRHLPLLSSQTTSFLRRTKFQIYSPKLAFLRGFFDLVQICLIGSSSHCLSSNSFFYNGYKSDLYTHKWIHSQTHLEFMENVRYVDEAIVSWCRHHAHQLTSIITNS